MKIPLFWPQIYKEEWLKALGKTFDTRWIGQGPLVEKFEQEFGLKFGYKYCLAVNSGTSALDLAYHMVGIEKGDEVLTPVLTCTATNIPLLRRRAKLKFVDIDDNLLPSFEDIAQKITNKTKAIVVVNLGGLQVDKRIFKLAKNKNIPVIIDAAQSVGLSEKYGDYVCYSFQAIKHFTTGDGGMLIIRKKKLYDKAKKLRWFGIDREAKKRANWKWSVNHQMALDIEELGFKYHMNDMAASMGLVGLTNSDNILKYRKALCDIYNQELSEYTKICGGSYWLFGILDDHRNHLMDFLSEHGIESDPIQIRNDIFSVFGGKRHNLPNMKRLEDKYLYLPLNGKITIKDVRKVIRALKEWKKK